jgi:P-type conjugative transfer protein TrbG
MRFATALLATSVLAQEKPSEAVPVLDKYPFGQIMRTLEDAPPPSQGPKWEPKLKVDVPIHLERDVPLPPIAQAALDVHRTWLSEEHAPAAGKDGRVLYTYGAGLATIVCAPLRVCILELEAGEKIIGEPHVGDSVRWLISPASSGRGVEETPLVVLKPKQTGLDTTLLITTDRRAYYLRLISKPDDYLARVGFAYPEDEVRRWKAATAEQERRRQQEAQTKITAVESIENLYFDYRILGSDENIRPIRVVDDGKKTYIQMTANAVHRETPALVIVSGDGAEMVNYRVKGDMYIVDRLFERGALVLGSGKTARKADILRGTYRGKVKGDPNGKYKIEEPKR